MGGRGREGDERESERVRVCVCVCVCACVCEGRNSACNSDPVSRLGDSSGAQEPIAD